MPQYPNSGLSFVVTERISTKVANTASSYMAAWAKPMHETTLNP